MNNSLGDYENKLDLIIRNIKNNNKIKKKLIKMKMIQMKNIKKKEISNEEKK